MGTLARQATLNSLFSYIGIGLGFANVVLLYPSILAADEFGLTRLLVSMAAVVAQVSQLGADNTLIRYFPYFRDPENAHRGILRLLLSVGLLGALVGSLLLFLFHPQLSRIFSDRNSLYGSYGLFLIPLVVSEIFFILLRAYSRSLRRSVPPTFLGEFLLRALQAILILYQAWRPMELATFMLLYTSVFVLTTLALLWDLWRNGHWRLGPRKVERSGRMMRSMRTYGLFTLSASLAVIVLGNLDQMMFGALLSDGMRYVAYYAVAFYFGSVIAIPARSIGLVALPMIADAWRARNMSLIAELYRRSALVQLVLGAFLFLVIQANLDGLFTLLPPEYLLGYDVVLIIALANLLNIAMGLNGGIITMSRNYRFDAMTSMLLLVLNAAANFFLIRSMGIVGAAWATFLSLATVNIVRLIFLYRKHRLWPFAWNNLWVIGIAIGTALVVSWIPSVGSMWGDLVLRTAAVAMLFWPPLLMFRMVPDLSALMVQARERLTN